jgi:manganese/zinc/iron transport system permease protein
MSASIIIMIVGALVGASCGLIGTFMVLRRLALLGDAISHSILLGIVAVFWATHLRSPLLMAVGAGAVGLLTVALVAWLQRTGLVKEDAAIGLVFPFLFAVGVFFVSRFPSTVHIDVDAVLYGEIAYTPLYRFELFGHDLGTQAFWTMGTMLAADALFVIFLYKELKLSTFDAGMAAALGMSPVLLHYGLMAMISATTVVAFDAVGAVLVVAMLIVPAATAQLLTRSLPLMLALSTGVGAISALLGYQLAHAVNGSIAGAIATMLGIMFTTALALAPRQGLVAQMLRRGRQAREFTRELLVAHVAAKDGGVPLASLEGDFGWASATISRAVADARAQHRISLDERGILTAVPTSSPPAPAAG